MKHFKTLVDERLEKQTGARLQTANFYVLFRRYKSKFSKSTLDLKNHLGGFVRYILDSTYIGSAGCQKIRYMSRKEAKKAQKRINQEQGRKIIKQQYFCSACHHWHLSSMDKSKEVKVFNKPILIIKN